MLITPDQVARALRCTVEQATAALAGIDQEAIRHLELAGIVARLWDQASLINGCPALVILSREDVIPGAPIYLLDDAATGQTLYIQPHAPHVDGHVAMTPENVMVYAEEERQRVAGERAQARIVEAVVGRLQP